MTGAEIAPPSSKCLELWLEDAEAEVAIAREGILLSANLVDLDAPEVVASSSMKATTWRRPSGRYLRTPNPPA
jgi:hypothetical protein